MDKTERDLIDKCVSNDRIAQNQLYQRFAPLFLSICRRYHSKLEVAEDVMIHAFYRIFEKMHTYSDRGSFEGWMKRIVINECLMELRKRKNLYMTVAIEDMYEHPSEVMADPLQYEELIALLDLLPNGYRTVFNLYVIEGFKHREIADMLQISINTSKSQLILARKKLRQLIKKKYNHGLTA